MFVTRARAVCVVIALSRHRYAILAAELRGREVMEQKNKLRKKKSGGKRKRPAKNGVCIGGIANGNIAGNLVSCLGEINAYLRIYVTPSLSSPSRKKFSDIKMTYLCKKFCVSKLYKMEALI